MSGHERERLCAYLDGELPPGERAEFEAHLAACPACTALLADMGAVDATARSLPVEAPDGYFEAFPSRVVARLGAASRPPARPRRLPAWTWAAAAALLLAVVAPLTLRHPAPGPVPSTTPGPGAPQPPFEAQDQKRERDALKAPDARPLPAARPQPGFASPPVAAQPAAPGGPALGESRFPAGKSARNEVAPEAARVTLPPPATPAEDEAPREKRSAAPTQSGAREEPAQGTAQAFALPDGVREPARDAPAASTAPLASSARRDEGTAGALSVTEADRAFGRLEASRPRTAAEWRQLRDAWGAFAAAHPHERRADEARVRAIEAGREAWLAGGANDDEAAFRREADAYLEREGALQKARVEGLLLSTRRP